MVFDLHQITSFFNSTEIGSGAYDRVLVITRLRRRKQTKIFAFRQPLNRINTPSGSRDIDSFYHGCVKIPLSLISDFWILSFLVLHMTVFHKLVVHVTLCL